MTKNVGKIYTILQQIEAMCIFSLAQMSNGVINIQISINNGDIRKPELTLSTKPTLPTK
jgi:hypothetical protein